jgi:DNA polymerase-1
MIIFDIETDGLLQDVTKVHCLVIQDTRTGKVWDFHGSSMKEGLTILAESPEIGGHNIIAFDIPVLEKLYGFDYKGEVFDTLVASRLIWSNLKEKDLMKRTVSNRLIGSHSLKAWGERLNYHKGSYGEQEDAWESFTPEMLEYCKQDVGLNVKLYEMIQRKRYPHEPMQLEHDMAKMLFQQEQTGFPFDVEAAQKLYTRLSARKQEIETELVNTLEPTVIELKTKTKTIPFNPASRQQIADR